MSLAQTVTSVAVILSAGGSFACFYILLHLPMTLSIYLALPFAMPFALAGFLRIHGMPPIDYLKKRRKVMQTAILTRRPAYVVNAVQIMNEIHAGKAQAKAGEMPKGKKVILQSEDEIFLRAKEFEKLSAGKE